MEVAQIDPLAESAADASVGIGSATRVLVYGVEDMVPSVLDDAEKRAWLSTPLAGAPLYRRLLEPLVGLNVAELDILDTGSAARALARLMATRGYFGTTPRLVAAEEIESMAIEQLVLYPGNMLSLNARELTSRLMAAFSEGSAGTILRMTERDGAGEAVVVAGRAAQFLKPELLSKPTFECATDLAKKSASRPISCDAIRGYRPGTPARLVDLARAALDEKLFSPVGVYEDGVLIGPRAKICKGAVLDGAAAVGAESYIAPSAMLCEGSIVGEKCYVGEGALVSDAIVLDGAHVAPGEFVLSVVRGPKGKIEL
jgi:hypothetical protein